MKSNFWWYEEEELRKQAEAEARTICYDRDWFIKFRAGLYGDQAGEEIPEEENCNGKN